MQYESGKPINYLVGAAQWKGCLTGTSTVLPVLPTEYVSLLVRLVRCTVQFQFRRIKKNWRKNVTSIGYVEL
jgi:hypothetical protein